MTMRPNPLPALPLPAPAASGRRRPAIEPETARLHLLEFVWSTKAGLQPVLYLVRTYLH